MLNDFFVTLQRFSGKLSSVGLERLPYKQEVTGSTPVVSTGSEKDTHNTDMYFFLCRDWQNRANVKDPEGLGLSPKELETAIKTSLKAGAAGISLFTPERMTEEH